MMSLCTITTSSRIISFRPWYNRPRTTKEISSSFPWGSYHLVTQWETKMIKLRDTLETVSDVVKSPYLSQMRFDTKDYRLKAISAWRTSFKSSSQRNTTGNFGSWPFTMTWGGALISTICDSMVAHAISMYMTRTSSLLAKAKTTPPGSIKTSLTNS